ncbi:MAG: Wzz/FepE/Etk N-terminal domain-containing protein [Burkholderiales bacterium]
MTDSAPGTEYAPGNNREPARDDESLDVLDLLVAIGKRKRFVLGVPLAAAVLSAAISFVLPAQYTATTRILPPQQSQSNAAMLLSQLGGALGGLGNLAAGASLKSPAELYASMLGSRSVADDLIKRFDLLRVYEEEYPSRARKALERRTDIKSDRSGIITLEYTDRDAKRAADVANAYVDELTKLTQTLAIGEASQRRLFFERQLEQENNRLADAEVALKRTQEKTGLIKLDEQGKALIEAIGGLRARIAAKEVQLDALRTFSSSSNPDYVRSRAELAGLQAQLSKLESSRPARPGDVFVPASQIPESGLEYVRRLREVKYHETLFELLAKQLELAKLDEAHEGSLVQVMDRAIPPDRRSSPKRTLIVAITTLAAAFAAVAWALLAEFFDHAMAGPAGSDRLRSLRDAWRAPPLRKP